MLSAIFGPNDPKSLNKSETEIHEIESWSQFYDILIYKYNASVVQG
jgi:hypothetical protein